MITHPEASTFHERCGLEDGRPLLFAACYVYSPAGQTPAAQHSRLLCSRLKAGRSGWLRVFVTRLCEQVHSSAALAGIFAPEVLLVPIPGSAAEPCSAPWIAHRLAREIQRNGLAAHVWPALARCRTLPRSASCYQWQRPTVIEHWRALLCEPALAPEIAGRNILQLRVVLIDDVVTKGRTLLAAAMRLRECFPQASIQAFALFRTTSFASDFSRVLQPCRGEIRWNGRDAERRP
jgi:hypothetical protein